MSLTAMTLSVLCSCVCHSQCMSLTMYVIDSDDSVSSVFMCMSLTMYVTDSDDFVSSVFMCMSFTMDVIDSDDFERVLCSCVCHSQCVSLTVMTL